MMKVLRRIIFFMFFAAFLIGAPKIIFYALGYSYRAGSKKGLIQTGLVYLSTTPPGATVYVGGRRYHDPTPAIIRDLLPGNYPIRLVLKDHEIWSKTVPVEAAKASVLGKILLHPKKPEWHSRVLGKFENLIAIPETKYILLKDAKDLRKMQVYDQKEEKAVPLFTENIDKNLRLSDIYSIPGSTHVLIEAEDSGKRKWAWIDLDKEGKSKIVWEEYFPFKPESVRWSAKDNHCLFAFKEGRLGRFDLEKIFFTSFPDKVLGYGVSERKLFLLTGDGGLVSTDFLDKNRKPFLKNQPRLLSELKGPFEVRHLSEDMTFFLGQDGELFVGQRDTPLVGKNVLDFSFDKKHHKVVIWTKNSIGTVVFSKEKKEQPDFQNEKVDWLLQQASEVSAAFWAHDGSYIIFQDQAKVFLLELETFGAPSLYELLETKGRSHVFYNDDSGELFYLDKNTGNLMSLEVVPKWKVLEVPFSLLREKEKEGKFAA